MAISIPGSLARWAREGFQRSPASDCTAGPGELSLGAPRIQGELLMLRVQRVPGHGVTLPACTEPTAGTVVADFSVQSSDGVQSSRVRRGAFEADAGLNIVSCWAQFKRLQAAQSGTLRVGLRCSLGRQQPTLKVVGTISLAGAHCDRGVTHIGMDIKTTPQIGAHCIRFCDRNWRETTDPRFRRSIK
jgi:hypothetical protein